VGRIISRNKDGQQMRYVEAAVVPRQVRCSSSVAFPSSYIVLELTTLLGLYSNQARMHISKYTLFTGQIYQALFKSFHVYPLLKFREHTFAEKDMQKQEHQKKKSE